MKLSEELAWRGSLHQTTYSDVSVLDKPGITFYWGVDPSARSMTIGHLAIAIMIRRFIDAGHKPVLLVGGATGLIGDPDGKQQERHLKSPEEVEGNKKNIAKQYKKIFGNSKLTIVDNYDWFKDLNYLTFLRDVGKHVPMRQMLGREFVQSRLNSDGSGISYAEFSYSLIQGYDFVYLNKNKNVTLQVCGSDQWGNSIAGVELSRRMLGKEVHVLSAPLVINKSTGRKFGKTEDGAVWLDSSLTSEFDFYQFWLNVDDDSVEDYLKIYTLLTKDEIKKTMAAFLQNKAERHAQKTLAYEVTSLVHGEASARNQSTGGLSNRTYITDNTNIIDVLILSELASSKTDARRLIEGGSVYINDCKVLERSDFNDQDFIDGSLELRKGKKLQNSVTIKKD